MALNDGTQRNRDINDFCREAERCGENGPNQNNHVVVFYNANLMTMEGPRIPRGWMRVEGGKITAIGSMDSYETQEGAIDLSGALVLPGFVDAHCHMGLFEDSLGFEGEDGNEDTDPLTPHLRAIDAVNPMERSFAEALAGGVTTVVTGPGSANPIGGQICAMKTAGRRVDSMAICGSLAVKFALGENPKVTYNSKSQGPITRMATAALIRDMLRKAQEYLEAQEKAQEDDECDEPEYDAKCEALLPVLRREAKAHFHCHRADDIFTAIRISKEFQLDYLLIHCTEGHLIADELLEEGAAAVCGPLFGTRSKPELSNFTPANPAILSRAGVPVAICTDHPEVAEQLLPLSAGLAVSEGMDYLEALRAITIVPARLCGIDRRVGSLTVGKDADFLIYRRDAAGHSDPLALGVRPEQVWVEGKRRI